MSTTRGCFSEKILSGPSVSSHCISPEINPMSQYGNMECITFAAVHTLFPNRHGCFQVSFIIWNVPKKHILHYPTEQKCMLSVTQQPNCTSNQENRIWTQYLREMILSADLLN